MDEILIPPADIQLDKDGVGLYFINPTEEELKEYDDKQWMWSVCNNNPERQFKKGVRLAYFTSEQIAVLDRVKEHMAIEDQIINNALVHCAEIVFPHLFPTPVDHGNEDVIFEAMYEINEIRWGMSDMNRRVREFARSVHKQEQNEDEIINHLRTYIYRHMHDNEYFVKYLNKLTKEQLLRIKMYLIGAVLFYQYYNLKDND